MLVSAVMITGKHPSRTNLARVAVRCFLEQTYSEKELVIINDSEIPLAVSNPQVREILVPFSPSVTLGDLRNLGIDHSRGDLLIQWDDDDWHHPNRIDRQVSAWTKGVAVLLREQIRYNSCNGNAFLHQNPKGIIGTILHERRCAARYPSIRKAEDTRFLRQFHLQNVVHSIPPLYIRLCHGANTWEAKFIMGDLAANSVRNQWRLAFQARKQLQFVVKHYYPFLEVRSSVGHEEH